MLVLVMRLTSGQACESKEIKLTDTLSPSPSPILYKDVLQYGLDPFDSFLPGTNQIVGANAVGPIKYLIYT